MSFFHFMFDWYHGQVWPNLIASAVTTTVVWLITIPKLVKLHKRSTNELHNHISQLRSEIKSKD